MSSRISHRMRRRRNQCRSAIVRSTTQRWMPRPARVVLEVDGQQHYADGMQAGATASPRLYSKMAAEDRALRLKGYEVYRFGGHELTRNEAAVTAMLQDFFKTLLAKHPFTAP
ncbi:DUF559 domain-containing protein [Nonomuraea sp. NPDC046570]|uniref:DUF559 domain-containing protein n=1 Tax=Nonomuraea sp. NPDC046570 TaxID=3155255 RepID=UPI0033DB12A4